jgi:hypothetical protein
MKMDKPEYGLYRFCDNYKFAMKLVCFTVYFSSSPTMMSHIENADISVAYPAPCV